MHRMGWTATLAAGAALLAGCALGQPSGPPAAAERKEPPREAEYLAKVAVKADERTEGETAVKSALEWARKYAEKCDEIERVNRDNQKLLQDSSATTKKAAKLETDLAQAQRELQEANAMLLELRKELGDWKRDVLGYREEMRAAQKAQLDALTKVLRLLGGEAPTAAAPAPASRPAPAAPAVPATGSLENDNGDRAVTE